MILGDPSARGEKQNPKQPTEKTKLMTPLTFVPPWHQRPAVREVGLACWLAITALSAHAQQVFKITGPDGTVTFSDRPPPAAPATVAGSLGNTRASTAPALPFELQQVANKYPVTLYTTNSCGPCDAGRRLLVQRGVPHAEKTVVTNDDLAAFARLTKDGGLPLLTIGGQQIKGYAEAEWSGYLDAAGYPKQSTLPTSYRQAAATPLVPLKIAPAATGSSADAASGELPAVTPRKRPVPTTPAPNSNNPAGIKF